MEREQAEQSLTTDDLAGRTADDADEPIGREQAEGSTGVAETAPLFDADERSGFESRWREIQTTFVDEPRESVARADQLVAELMQALASSFADERGRLEQQWDSGDDVSTEDLRVALTRYRSFFQRLLAA